MKRLLLCLPLAWLAQSHDAANAQYYPYSPGYYPPPGYYRPPPPPPPSYYPPAAYAQPYYNAPPPAYSGENCGTPDQFKPCPPLPRNPLPYYPR